MPRIKHYLGPRSLLDRAPGEYSRHDDSQLVQHVNRYREQCLTDDVRRCQHHADDESPKKYVSPTHVGENPTEYTRIERAAWNRYIRGGSV